MDRDEISIDWTEKDIKNIVFHKSYRDPMIKLYSLISSSISVILFFFPSYNLLFFAILFFSFAFVKWINNLLKCGIKVEYIKKVIIEKKETKSYNRMMNLFRNLSMGEDTTPENCLKDLVEYRKKINSFKFSNPEHHDNIVSTFEKLFEHCVELAEQSHELWVQSSKNPLATDTRNVVVENLLKARQKVSELVADYFKDVNEDVKNISNLEGVLNAFEANLTVAKNVEIRMNQIIYNQEKI